jgi:hypothetical protein
MGCKTTTEFAADLFLSRPTLGLTQLLAQWLSQISPGIKREERVAEDSSQSLAIQHKFMELCIRRLFYVNTAWFLGTEITLQLHGFYSRQRWNLALRHQGNLILGPIQVATWW